MAGMVRMHGQLGREVWGVFRLPFFIVHTPLFPNQVEALV